MKLLRVIQLQNYAQLLFLFLMQFRKAFSLSLVILPHYYNKQITIPQEIITAIIIVTARTKNILCPIVSIGFPYSSNTKNVLNKQFSIIYTCHPPTKQPFRLYPHWQMYYWAYHIIICLIIMWNTIPPSIYFYLNMFCINYFRYNSKHYYVHLNLAQ